MSFFSKLFSYVLGKKEIKPEDKALTKPKLSEDFVPLPKNKRRSHLRLIKINNNDNVNDSKSHNINLSVNKTEEMGSQKNSFNFDLIDKNNPKNQHNTSINRPELLLNFNEKQRSQNKDPHIVNLIAPEENSVKLTLPQLKQTNFKNNNQNNELTPSIKNMLICSAPGSALKSRNETQETEFRLDFPNLTPQAEKETDKKLKEHRSNRHSKIEKFTFKLPNQDTDTKSNKNSQGGNDRQLKSTKKVQQKTTEKQKHSKSEIIQSAPSSAIKTNSNIKKSEIQLFEFTPSKTNSSQFELFNFNNADSKSGENANKKKSEKAEQKPKVIKNEVKIHDFTIDPLFENTSSFSIENSIPPSIKKFFKKNEALVKSSIKTIAEFIQIPANNNRPNKKITSPISCYDINGRLIELKFEPDCFSFIDGDGNEIRVSYDEISKIYFFPINELDRNFVISVFDTSEGILPFLFVPKKFIFAIKKVTNQDIDNPED
ncbi:hypothetical protein M9Y10_033202 [Tritrichomonas musculus]|uniref:Uncharacterized protein n=1 Tax=Tritrichomonas musculus TaxID=1915356 RepID=A0ABR2GXC2_9EUKA